MCLSPLLVYLGALACAELLREQCMTETAIQHREKWAAFGVLTGLYLLFG